MKKRLKIQNTSNICFHCNSKDLEKIYDVKSSKKLVSIFFCDNCGLIQSRLDPKKLSNRAIKPHKKVRTISADADWGNIRHGKELRLNSIAIIDLIKKYAKGNILDIGSNRGDFIHFVKKNIKFKKIIALEPDPKLIKPEGKKIQFFRSRFENLDLKKNSFDFIYCCQTLEHIERINNFIIKCKNILHEKGFILIDIPNTSLIINDNVIEEYFIDKHHLHFDPISIVSIFKNLGLEIVSKNIESHNMIFLCKKREVDLTIKYKKNYILKRYIQNDYSNLLKKNRNLIKIAFNYFILPLIKRQKIAIWGISRVYDLFTKYSKISKFENILLVDTFTHNKINFIKKRVFHPDYLKIDEPDVLFIFAQSNEEYISKKAYSMGIRHIIKFSELLDQARLRL